MIVLGRPHGIRLLFVLRGSVLGRIAPVLATCAALAIAVTLTHGLIFHWKIALTPVPFSLIGLALAIFLGFRNGVAYDRYWEARKLWGDLVHRSRSFARQVQSLMNFESEPAVDDLNDPRIRLIQRNVAFVHALRVQLRHLEIGDDVLRWLVLEERLGLVSSRLPTDYLLRRMGADLGSCAIAGQIDARLAAEIDVTLSAMAAVAAGCERIDSTPIPLVYTLLLHRTAWLYCFLLPFGLVDSIGFMTPFVVVLVAYTFFGLDAVGDEIEDPFGMAPHHLPLDAICRTIEVNLREAMGEEELPPPLLPVKSRLS
jgi:putative membrane protein